VTAQIVLNDFGATTVSQMTIGLKPMLARKAGGFSPLA